jgi:RimJ/RimL family protein N-acetyltransferase
MTEYKLIPLSDNEIIAYYRWMTKEEHRENYSCRPITEMGECAEYLQKTNQAIAEGRIMPWMLIDGKGTLEGQIKGFDHNKRNHSMEFGYYIPEENRGKGYGNILIKLFLEKTFLDKELELNKLYATTAENNAASIKLLERNGFHLDGKNRETYWIGEKRYDQRVYSILKSELVI